MFLRVITLISASAGAGFALTLALIVGGVIWYSSRPQPPKPWNSAAIKATYDYIDTEGDKRTFVFYYALENETDADYKVDSNALVTVGARLQEQKSLSMIGKHEGVVKIDYPIFVPARQRVRFVIHLLAYPYKGEQKLNSDASREERRNYHEALEGYVRKELANLDGFVLFDEVNRYQINFPKGW